VEAGVSGGGAYESYIPVARVGETNPLGEAESTVGDVREFPWMLSGKEWVLIWRVGVAIGECGGGDLMDLSVPILNMLRRLRKDGACDGWT